MLIVRPLIVLVLCLAAGAAFAQAARKPAENDWLIVPGQRLGPITASTSRARLPALLPGAKFEDTEEVSEDHTKTAITNVSGGAADMTVYWSTAKRSRITQIVLRSPDAKWRTSDGIRVGMPVSELARLNGAPLTFSGFGWEFGGMIEEWHGGKLEKMPLPLTLGPTQQTGGNELFGDGVKIRSDDARAAKAAVAVESITVHLK